MSETIVVTGAAGFIGSNFIRYWTTQYPNDMVIALDALTYAGERTSLASVDKDVVFVHGDIRDQDMVEKLLRTHDVDVVINFAAESHNSYAIMEPAKFFSTNVMGPVALLDAIRNTGTARLHHISTCEVYGDLDLDDTLAFTEEAPYRPRTPYNAAKAAGDHAVRAYGITYEIPITITNCCNNYGPYQFPEKLIPLFTSNALQGKPLPLYKSSKNRREWLHVIDHCRAIDLVLKRGRIGETYNVGSGMEADVESIADMILDRLGLDQSLKTTVPDRPSHDRRYLLDSSKLRTDLGWSPQTDLQEGLRETIDWYAANRAWWEPLIGRSPVEESGWTTGRP